MTAEVVVMNKSAIAMAADSKVTIGGSRMSKTYDTVNKLFTLSKIHPVGVMIYGNADFMQYPWETLIKLYRKQRGGDNEATIKDWAKDFSSFISRFGKISLQDKKNNLKEVARAWFASVLDESDDAAISRGISIGTADYIVLLKGVFVDKITAILEKDKWLNTKTSTDFIAKFGSIVDEVTKEFVDEFGDAELSKIADQFISSAIFSKYPSPLSSGIVIAGFGEDEYFPTVVSLECDGYVGSRLKIYEEGVLDISRNMTGAMRAFAQSEMVQRFMSGIDPMLASALMTAFSEVLNENCLEVLEKYGAKAKITTKTKADVTAAVHASMEVLAEQVNQYTTRSFSNPVVQMISLLPKDELANLAESLVALTSLKRRVSSDIETVGGAIDVALISKSDGFVWIKRKYYFPEELNPQFNKNYMSDILEGAIYDKSKSTPLRRSAIRKPTGASSTKKTSTSI
jgi:hypothetical protein